MATTDSIILKSVKGTIENITVYQRNGKTVIRRAKNSNVSKTRSHAQQIYRIRFANCVRLAKRLLSEGLCCFPDRKPGSTEYNAFMHHNTPICNCYLTREQLDAYLAMPFEGMVLSAGTLPPVELDGFSADGVLGTTISLGESEVAGSTPIGEVCSAVVNNNIGIHQGDELVIAVCKIKKQDKPFPEFVRYVLPLCFGNKSVAEVSNITFLRSRADADGRRVLAFDTAAIEHCAGMAVYLRRQSDTAEQCSLGKLRLLPHIDSRYSTREAFDRAIESFGGVTPLDYLTPDIEHKELVGEFAPETN